MRWISPEERTNERERERETNDIISPAVSLTDWNLKKKKEKRK